jgi:hypothetical protein
MVAQSKPAQQQQLTPLAAALAGALGGCFSSACVVPLYHEFYTDYHISVVYPLDV